MKKKQVHKQVPYLGAMTNKTKDEFIDNFNKDKEFRHRAQWAMTAEKLARQVKLNRKARGLTAGKLAKKAGLSAIVVKSIERRKIDNLTIEDLQKIAHVFGCSLDISFKSSSASLTDFLVGENPPAYIPSFEEEMG